MLLGLIGKSLSGFMINSVEPHESWFIVNPMFYALFSNGVVPTGPSAPPLYVDCPKDSLELLLRLAGHGLTGYEVPYTELRELHRTLTKYKFPNAYMLAMSVLIDSDFPRWIKRYDLTSWEGFSYIAAVSWWFNCPRLFTHLMEKIWTDADSYLELIENSKVNELHPDLKAWCGQGYFDFFNYLCGLVDTNGTFVIKFQPGNAWISVYIPNEEGRLVHQVGFTFGNVPRDNHGPLFE